jgi:spore maturation protein B
VLSMAVVRPLSEGSAREVLDGIATAQGVDSILTRIAAVMNGSAETVLYVAALYFGSVGIRRMRHGIPAALVGSAAAMVGAVVFCRWLAG